MSAPSISPAGLAGRHGLDLDAASVRVEEAGLDYRVAFARDIDGVEWVLRIPRRPDVSAKLAEEQRILAFVAPRLSMAVPRWEVCSEELIAYRRLPGEPGLTLDGSGQPVWHVEPSSPAFAAALGRLIAELQALDLEAARTAGIPASSMSEIRTRWRADVERVGAAFEIAPPLRARWQAWLDNDALWPWSRPPPARRSRSFAAPTTPASSRRPSCACWSWTGSATSRRATASMR